MSFIHNTLEEAQAYHALLVKELGQDNTLTQAAASEVSAFMDGIKPIEEG